MFLLQVKLGPRCSFRCRPDNATSKRLGGTQPLPTGPRHRGSRYSALCRSFTDRADNYRYSIVIDNYPSLSTWRHCFVLCHCFVLIVVAIVLSGFDDSADFLTVMGPETRDRGFIEVLLWLLEKRFTVEVRTKLKRSRWMLISEKLNTSIKNLVRVNFNFVTIWVTKSFKNSLINPR